MKPFLRILVATIGLLVIAGGALFLVGGKQFPVIAETRIDASPDQVFWRLIDPDEVKKWVAGLEQIEPLTEGGHRVGARAKLTMAQGNSRFELEDEVLQSVPNQSLVVRMSGNMVQSISAVQLTSDRDATVVRQIGYFTPRGFFRLTAPFAHHEVQQKMQDDLTRLKSLVEAAPTTSTATAETDKQLDE
ncbi:MAG: SRPBCC family protein [Pirellulaceae bacterium]